METFLMALVGIGVILSILYLIGSLNDHFMEDSVFGAIGCISTMLLLIAAAIKIFS